MSIIGVEITKNKIKMSFDSQTTIADERVILNAEPKVFRASNLIVGIAGSTIVKQYLKEYISHSWNSKLQTSYDVHNLMNGFIETNRDNKHIAEADDLGVVIISDGERVYRFDLRNWSCHEVTDFYFIGSSWQTAEGAYIAYREIGKRIPEYKSDFLYDACVVACKQDLYSSEPINIIEIDRKS